MSLKRLATISAVLMFGIAAFGFSTAADAGVGFGYSSGGYGYSAYSGGYGGYNAYSGGYSIQNYNVTPYRAPVYHDTTHYDYHPTSAYRHGNHYHVVPGHYDLHRTGHYHY